MQRLALGLPEYYFRKISFKDVTFSFFANYINEKSSKFAIDLGSMKQNQIVICYITWTKE